METYALPGLFGCSCGLIDFEPVACACVLRNTSDAAVKAVTPAFFIASFRVIFSSGEMLLLMLFLFSILHISLSNSLIQVFWRSWFPGG